MRMWGGTPGTGQVPEAGDKNLGWFNYILPPRHFHENDKPCRKEVKKLPKNMFKKSRMKAGHTQEKAAEMTGYSIREIQRFEAGTQFPPAESVLLMAEKYNSPELIRWYRGEMDPIGREFQPPVLNNVNTSLFARFCKYVEELDEASDATKLAAKIILNKNSADQCTEWEVEELMELFQEAVADIHQALDELQQTYMEFFGVRFHIEIMRRHREKMINRGYLVVENKKPVAAMVAEERAVYGQKNKAASAAR